MSALYNPTVTIGVISLVLLAATISRVSSNSNGTVKPFYKNLSSSLLPILLGDIWPIDEYCHDTRLNKSIEDNAVVSYLLRKNNERDRYYNSRNDDEVYLVNVKSSVISVPTCSYQTWGYESREDLLKSGLPYKNQDQCSVQLRELLEQIAVNADNATIATPTTNTTTSSNKTITISQVNGHVPDNFLEGNIHWTGSYGLCVNVADRQFLFKGSTPMRYCLGAMKSRNWPQQQPVEETKNMNYFIRVGLCLPRSCDTSMLNEVPELKAMVERLAKHNLISPFNWRYNLTDIYCLPDEESPLRQLDTGSKIMIMVATLWLAVIIYSTMIWRRNNDTTNQRNQQDIDNNNITLTTIRNNDQNSSNLLRTKKTFEIEETSKRDKGFEWIKNWSLCYQFEMFIKPPSYLTNPAVAYGTGNKEQDNFVAFYVLDVVKVISGIWLVLSHGLLYYRGMLDNTREHVQTDDDWSFHLIRHGVNMVSIFFLIAGFLMSYKLFSSNKPVIFWRVIVSRYIRLLPLYLVVYTFVKKFGPLLGSGPFWDYGVSANSERRQCSKESWFIPWLLLADFITPFAHCLITGWHLANDFKITFTIPFLVIAMKKIPKPFPLVLGCSLVALSSLLCSVSFYQNRSFNFGHLMMDGAAIKARTFMTRTSSSYVNPIYRFGSFYMGVILAYIIVNYEKRRRNGKINENNQISQFDKLTKSRASTRKLIYSFAFVFTMALIETSPPCVKNRLYYRLGEEVARTVIKPLWTLLNEISWFLLMYHLLRVRGPQRLHKLLKWMGWNYLVKLNLCLILTHNEINRTWLSIQSRSIHFSMSNAYVYLASMLIVSYFVALLVHLAIERPLIGILENYITKKIANRPASSDNGAATGSKKTG